jgi:hypothetical protein
MSSRCTFPISPFIAPHAEQTCRLLSLYGGCIIQIQTGTIVSGVSYVRREGLAIPRIVHVENVDSRKAYVFMLDEVSGVYSNGHLELWPLAATTTCLPDVYTHLAVRQIGNLVEAYLEDVLPSARPVYAAPEHLRRQVRWVAESPLLWDVYWRCADQTAMETKKRLRRRLHQNVWPSRKLLCLDSVRTGE